MPEVSHATKELVSKYALWQRWLKPREGAATIHVDEVAKKVAVFYEQIRTIIDWKEEHLMRRAAIIRKLKRRFLDLELNNFAVENIAQPLVLELIRGGYFPNDKIEESKIPEVQRTVEKYVFILKNNPEYKRGNVGLQFYNQLMEIAACEVEETLVPSLKEMALIDFMFDMMRQYIKVSDSLYERGLLKKEDTDIQIYIAVQKALFKLDEPIISYNLLKYKYSYWQDPSEEELLKISQNIHRILENIERDLSHPAAKKFYVVCEKYDTPYLLLGDILSKEDHEKTLLEISNPATLEPLIREAYAKRLQDLKAKITRGAIYAVVSIFITKIITLLVLEWSLAWLFGHPTDAVFFIADILIPTGLMALLVVTARPPSKKNLMLAIMETIKIVYEKDKPETYEIRMAPRTNMITRAGLSFMYLLGACVTFGALYIVFNYFDFPIASIIINFIFIALILFAGTAVQKKAQELTIEEHTGGMLEFISDILLLPITAAGRWMSNTFKQYNAIAAFFNALIDMPFSTFVEFLEGWRYFMKEKKEEIQ